MKVINRTSSKLIAFGWHMKYGYGDDMEINSGQSVEVLGPYVGEMGGEDCHVALAGSEIVCHDGPDSRDGFHVSLGNPLTLQGEDDETGVSIRHHSEPRTF